MTAVAAFMLTADACCILVSAVLAHHVSQPASALGLVDRSFAVWPYFLVFLVVWAWVGGYQGAFVSHRKDPLANQLWDVCKGAIVTLVFGDFVTTIAPRLEADPRFLLIFGLFMVIAIAGFRVVLALSLWIIRLWGFNARHVLIIGANDRTVSLVSTIIRHSQFGYKIIGLLDDEEERAAQFERFGVPYLGKLDDLEHILQEHIIDEVHVGLPVRSYYETIQRLADLCMGVGVPMRLVADLFPLRLASSRLHRIEGIPMLSMTMVSESVLQLAVKRVMDIAGALVLIVLNAPIMIAAAIAIKIDSPGPVFFTQERVGLNQRKFNMIKFRSMVLDAEDQREGLEDQNELDGPIFKIRDDPRITRVGRFIRKYSVDEIPQLFNVLTGSLSLVGPRPHPTHEVQKYSFNQRRRLSVKPGMTGLAQVTGRSSLTWEESLQQDLAYIDNWSILLDFAILLKTVRAVVLAQGAT